MATANYSKAYADYMNQRNEINRKATLDSLLNGLNQSKEQAKANLDQTVAAYNRAITENQNEYNSNVAGTNTQYQGLINQVQKNKYNSQKLLNERNARLYGLNDSGASRTNALRNETAYNNRTSDLQTQKQQTLQNLLNQMQLRNREYNDAILAAQNNNRADLLGLDADYYSNLARINAQYDSNILPWYEEQAPAYGGYGYYNSTTNAPAYTYTAKDKSPVGAANAVRYIGSGALNNPNYRGKVDEFIEKIKKGTPNRYTGNVTRGGLILDNTGNGSLVR